MKKYHIYEFQDRDWELQEDHDEFPVAVARANELTDQGLVVVVTTGTLIKSVIFNPLYGLPS